MPGNTLGKLSCGFQGTRRFFVVFFVCLISYLSTLAPRISVSSISYQLLQHYQGLHTFHLHFFKGKDGFGNFVEMLKRILSLLSAKQKEVAA